MERKPHGLLLLFEGLPATVVQSQVLARLRWVEAAGLASYDVLTFAPSRKLHEESLQRLKRLSTEFSGKVTILPGIKPALPGSRHWHRRHLRQWLQVTQRRYAFVHARSDYAAAVAGPLAAELGFRMLWDCRGDVEGEFIERQGDKSPAALITWRARQSRLDAAIAAQSCTAASFVSSSLAARWRALLGGKPSVILPCLGDEQLFFFDPGLRAATRARLGFGKDDIVLVYSGSLGFYQGFGLVADLFRRTAERMAGTRLLVLTPHATQTQAELADIDPARVTVTTAAFEEVNAYLNAADIGLLLRPPSRTNAAAFPTKFAEYGLAGLNIVVTPALPDCFETARAAGNLIDPAADLGGARPSDARRREIMRLYRDRLTHDAMRERSAGLYAHL